MAIDGSGARAAALAETGVRGVMIGWADNNGIARSRTVPIGGLESV
jgi:glutamine synthetase